MKPQYSVFFAFTSTPAVQAVGPMTALLPSPKQLPQPLPGRNSSSGFMFLGLDQHDLDEHDQMFCDFYIRDLRRKLGIRSPIDEVREQTRLRVRRFRERHLLRYGARGQVTRLTFVLGRSSDCRSSNFLQPLQSGNGILTCAENFFNRQPLSSSGEHG
jgi:hypothetical protein